MSETRISRGVKFEISDIGDDFREYHSLDDFGLVLQPYTIPYPEVKLSYLDNTGGDGSIDLSETFGDVLFYDRVFKLVFQKLDRSRAWEGIIEPVANAVHGKKIRIRFDTDPDFYYIGRCRLLDLTPQRLLGSLAVELRCEPYKYQNVNRLATLPAATNTSATVTLPGSRMRVCMTVTTNIACTVSLGNHSVSLLPGTHQPAALERLPLDASSVTVTNTNTSFPSGLVPQVRFTYKRGYL